MTTTCAEQWSPARDAWNEFARRHTALGIRGGDHSWVHFQRVHAQKLIDADVLRRSLYRGRMLADTERFDAAVFNLLTTGDINGRAAARAA